MADTENDYIVTFYVENHVIVANAKTVATEFRVSQRFGVLEWVIVETKTGFSDALLGIGIKPINVRERLRVYTSGKLNARMPRHVF